MNPAKRVRPSERDASDMLTEDQLPNSGVANILDGFRMVIEYFLYIAHVTGIHDDFQVMSDAWSMTIRVLSASGVPAELSHRCESSPSEESTLPRKFKAVVFAACALAVDVCGDFEASFAHSAVAWGTLFIDQIQSSPRKRTHESDCIQLMRMKMIIGRALRWDIGFNNPATSFCEYLVRLRENRECPCCQRLSGDLSRRQTSTLQGMSFLLSPRGKSSDVIALVTILFMHKGNAVRQTPTPFNNNMHLIPACLSGCISQHVSVGDIVDSLAYVDRHSEYFQHLVSETFSTRNSNTINTLLMIEKEYFERSSGDVASPSLN